MWLLETSAFFKNFLCENLPHLSLLRAFLFIGSMSVRAMPVTAQDGFFLIARLRCVHSVYPSRTAPGVVVRFPPVLISLEQLLAGDPSVHKDIAARFIIILHCRDDGLVIRRASGSGCELRPMLSGCRRRHVRKLKGGIEGAVRNVMS